MQYFSKPEEVCAQLEVIDTEIKENPEVVKTSTK
jgi:hypothetical protein